MADRSGRQGKRHHPGGSLKHQDIVGPKEDWYAENDAGYRDAIIQDARTGKPLHQNRNRWNSSLPH